MKSYERYLGWEETYPGRGSFSYNSRGVDWHAYPYKLKGLARELMHSHYEGAIDKFKDRGIQVHKLIRTEGKNWTFKNGRDYSEGKTETIYVVWSEEGETQIDFSSILEGEVSIVDGLSGE